MDFKLIDEARRKRRRAAASARAAAILVGATLAIGVAAWAFMVRMPGVSYRGTFAPLTPDERALELELRRDVKALAGGIGDRSLPAKAPGLSAAADLVRVELERAGYVVDRQRYDVSGQEAENVEATRRGNTSRGRSDEIVVVGAHYDSVAGAPGADDNASGVAALLAVARRFADLQPARTVRFVAFANEEPPFFQTPAMGSRVYARRCRERGDRIVAMLSLETLGFYSDEPDSQHYPAPFGLFYPTTGDFVGFVGDTASRRLVHRALASFRAHVRFPSEGVAAPSALPGIGWSDHWSFWQEGYPAVMVTDTAPFRNSAYHTTRDLPERFSYAPFARVVSGLVRVTEDLANGP